MGGPVNTVATRTSRVINGLHPLPAPPPPSPRPAPGALPFAHIYICSCPQLLDRFLTVSCDCRGKNEQVLRHLLEVQAATNYKNKLGLTPPAEAIVSGRTQAAELLLDKVCCCCYVDTAYAYLAVTQKLLNCKHLHNPGTLFGTPSGP